MGCAQHEAPVAVRDAGPWTFQAIHGRQFTTEHYLIHTTVSDPAAVERFGRVMEAALTQYRALAPGIPQRPEPMEIFYFGTLKEWEDFTIATAGKDAAIYLQVFAGGYTVRDRFVCWLGNEPDTLAVAAHEGFHQYVGRNFVRRLPPVLEEGLATLFERVSVGSDAATIDVANNARRAIAIKRAVDGGYLIPLDTLLQLHAGDLIDRPVELREAFYAQAWALARYLRDTPQTRLAFQQMLTDTARGNQILDIGTTDGSGVYDAAKVRPLLQKYVAPDWPAFVAAYDRYIRATARMTTE
jgi:hypothetical protein